MRIDRGGISCWGNLCMISPLWGEMGVIALPTVLNESAGRKLAFLWWPTGRDGWPEW